MKELSLIILNKTGLHARPAKVLSKLAKKYQSNVLIQYGDKEANAKSMISLLKLGVKQAAEINLVVDGADEAEASANLAEAIKSGLGEPLPEPGEDGSGETAVAQTPPATSLNGTATTTEQAKTELSSSSPVEEKETAENLCTGLAASPGIAIGPVFRLVNSAIVIPDRFLGADEELAALSRSLSQAVAELEQVEQKMVADGKTEESEIFAAQREILQDPDLRLAVENEIGNGRNHAQSWRSQIDQEANKLASLADSLLAARAADVRDVGERVLRLMTGQTAEVERPSTPHILLASDLAPSDTASLDPQQVLGLATSEGGPTAHSAIIARALGVPAVVGLGQALDRLKNGQVIILDGAQGTFLFDPTPEQLSQAEAKQKAEQEARKAAEASATLAAKLTDGRLIEIGANAGSAAEAKTAFDAGADGIGLLRTEFLFLGREMAPSEDDQQETYSAIVKAMEQRPVIFRTLDIGGDKPVPYITVAAEENPFLGERGIRLQLNRPELLRGQLRALFKSIGSGKIRIMFPMIGRLDEWRAARKIAEEVRAELGAAQIDFGIMVEIPSAAIMAHAFAKEVDFFSIGTNDLTQYTLAIDRQHPTLTAHADGLDPAVLSLIKMTADAAKANGKWTGVCGELGSDPQAVPILIGLGVDELSVNVKAVARVKAQVRTLSEKLCQDLAQKALACTSAAEVRALEYEISK